MLYNYMIHSSRFLTRRCGDQISKL